MHLDATLRMFVPDHDPAALRPKQVIPPRSIYFQMGEVTKRIRDALREATEPLSAEAIAITTMQDKGLDASDSKLRADFIRRILWALKRLATQGKVERVGAGLGVRWRLVTA
jgi:hypothetical protein